MDRLKYLYTCLEAEKAADVASMSSLTSSLTPKQLASRGLAIVNLTLASLRTGFGGKLVATLEPDVSISPEMTGGNDIRTGDLIKIVKGKATKDDKSVEAVVLKSTKSKIEVALDESFDATNSLDGVRLHVIKLANNATYRRMEFALNDMQKMKEQEMSDLMRVCVDKETISDHKDDPNLQLFNTSLNASQVEAVQHSVGSAQVTVVHGPPGTGKTHTLVEIIRQLVQKKGQRVLVCGPSNISVDTLLERLHPHFNGNQLLRIGHPARLLEANLQHSLDIVSKTCDSGQIVKDVQVSIDQQLRKISKTKSGREKYAMYKEIGMLRKEFKERQKKVVADLLLQAKVVCATLHGTGDSCLKDVQFDTIIIDEISQSLEPQCWIPISRYPSAQKLIIAGDNQQLPPTVKCEQSKIKKQLELTLFDHLVGNYDNIKRLLKVQYRMHDAIMQFPSQELYGGQLVAHSSVAEHTLADLPHVTEDYETTTPVIWIDTQGDDFYEQEDESGKLNPSRLNDSEAYLVRRHVGKLLDLGVSEAEIGVITPYSAQASLIRSLIHPTNPGVEVATVDSFQGREKEAIILSLVRSNENHEIGFLGEYRRLNVAMTRPRRHLCVVGNMETLSRGSEFTRAWAKHGEDADEIEFPSLDEVIELQQ
ncbi:DNA polymerase alpha-associated DNA helicase A [Yarrowia sp. C11]|nr:DNA polymerase alpha-associated DNA helicase A [Yarrowia sp. E02]KAG5373051.1 DNA polymerase alpha-associated DNA helicase A [Yarrowia sp. C11]